MTDKRDKLTFLYTNIGRGHPFYLDGIIEAMVRSGSINSVKNKTDVFEISSGLSKFAWKTVRYLYYNGSQDGFISKIYSKLRDKNDYNNPGLFQNILSRSVANRFASTEFPLIVAHPILVAALQGRKNLYYQHGEIITPHEAVVAGASKVFVPTKTAAEPFLNAGYDNYQIIITGLCIEPGLKAQAEDCFKRRMQRFQAERPIVGAFFSSGAEPVKHLQKIIASSISAVNSGGKVIIFCQNGGRLNKMFEAEYIARRIDYSSVESDDLLPELLPNALLVKYNSRREENLFVAKLFKHFDYFVSPSHERSNWAVGLGLPMFIVDPSIGPFSPLNRKYLLNSETSIAIKSSSNSELFGQNLVILNKEGKLTEMAYKGWEKEPIDGFNKIVEFFS